MYDHNARPSKRDRQTGRRTNIMAIARRFVLTNASRVNNCHLRGLTPVILLFLVLRCFLGQCLTKFGLIVVTISSHAVCMLRQLCSQDALILLRSSFNAPKVLHPCCCSPSLSHLSLAQCDLMLRPATLASQAYSGFS